jgi:hypothetical protein
LTLFAVKVATPSGVATINVLAASKWHAMDIVKNKLIEGRIISAKPKKI